MHREKGPGELFDYFVIFESFSGSGFSCRLHLRVFLQEVNGSGMHVLDKDTTDTTADSKHP